MKITFLALLLTPFISFSSSLTAAQLTFSEQLSDEFETAIDLQKWQVHLPYGGGRYPGFVSPENTYQENGHAQLWVKSIPRQETFTTPHLQSTKKVLYGFFEVRARIMPGHVNSAFWLYRYAPEGTFEIDIFETSTGSPVHRNIIHTNTHRYFGDPSKETADKILSSPKKINVGLDLSADFHIYGFYWGADELRWYFDGNLIRVEPNTDWHSEMNILLTAEIHQNWMGIPRPNELPASFLVDYLRTWTFEP